MTALKNYTAGVKSVRENGTHQQVRTPGRTDEVRNNAGGFVFAVEDKDRLERFLILGVDKGTYYVKTPALVKQNVQFIKDMIARNERGVVDTVVDVSVNGRASKNTPAIFVLALVMTEGKDKAYARDAVVKVCRTATHLFEFAQFVDDLGGWGSAKRKAVASWYTSKTAAQVAFQAVKYRQRNGWTHRDLFRLSHPVGVDRAVGEFILHGNVTENAPAVVKGFEVVQAAQNIDEVVKALGEYNGLTWESVPTHFHKELKLWKTLFYAGNLTGQALFRNITRLARLGALDDMVFAADVAKALTDREMLAKTRIHPINVLNTLVAYTEGQVDHSNDSYWGYYPTYRNLSWSVNPVISTALNKAYHESFKYVEPANKRTLIGVDVSGSMSQGANGIDLSCAQVSAAVAMTIARTEPYHKIMGFTSQFVDLGIGAEDTLSSAFNKVRRANFGSTDVAQPMLWAAQNKVAVDTFVVITDNETYAGRVKPTTALQQYRRAMGIDARLAVLGVASTEFTVADPTDPRQMDFVGFDSNAPKVLADFSAGRL